PVDLYPLVDRGSFSILRSVLLRCHSWSASQTIRILPLIREGNLTPIRSHEKAAIGVGGLLFGNAGRFRIGNGSTHTGFHGVEPPSMTSGSRTAHRRRQAASLESFLDWSFNIAQ